MFSPRYWTFFIIVLAAIAYSMIRYSNQPELTVSPADTFNYRTVTLDNGLQVVVLPDHRAPVVTQMVYYHVGAADEAPGESG